MQASVIRADTKLTT